MASVSSRGKHLLMAFSGDLVLHTHMRMHGSWHIYRPGERWRVPAHEMRVRVHTSEYVAVGFNIPVAEFLSTQQLARHPQIQALGPDLADPAFDRADVRRRMAEQGGRPIHDVLLDQRVSPASATCSSRKYSLWRASIRSLRSVRSLTTPSIG